MNRVPLILRLKRDRDHILVTVDNAMHDRRERWEVDRKRDGGDGRDGGAEGLEQLRLLNVQHFRSERLALVVDLRNAHAVGEGGDVKHVQQGRLGGTDFGVRGDELQVGRDFDGTTGDLGRDTEGLEEGGLAWFHTRVAGRDVDIERGDGTCTGWCGDAVGKDLVAGGFEVAIGEDEADVAFDVRKEALVLGVLGDESLDGTADLMRPSVHSPLTP